MKKIIATLFLLTAFFVSNVNADKTALYRNTRVQEAISDSLNSDGQIANIPREVVLYLTDEFTTDMVQADGVFYFPIGELLSGLKLTYVHLELVTAGTTGTCTVQIHNVTQAADMLTTRLTVDTTPDTGSDEAATPAVIDTADNGVSQYDVIRIDVDTIHSGVAGKGAILTMGFAP